MKRTARTNLGLLFGCVLTLLVLGCQGSKRPSNGSAPTQQASAQAEEQPYRFAVPERLVAFGDVHGDLAATRRVLRLAGAIDERDNWIGGKLVVVQTGDQLDRGDQERRILDLFSKLEEQARSAGGAFHVLNGNHEIMNVAGDFRYVTPAGFTEFSDIAFSHLPESLLARIPEKARGRAAAFLPGGQYARQLARRNTIVVVGETVFVHGGVVPEHVTYGPGRINAEVSRWMNGELRQLPEIVGGANAPFWVRDYGARSPSEAACAVLGKTLEALRAKRMVTGHTVQHDGISAACDERVWRIDVGLANYYGDGPAQALEITAGAVRVLSAATAQ
jgi:hypothetical protein